MTPGLVSTVIPVFNRAGMLVEAVDSVLGQTWPQLEIVIVDDGSTDDTVRVAQALCDQHPGRILLVRQRNAGPGVARQAGFEACSGEFVQFLDSDDLLLPRKFELQVGGLRADPEAGISYGPTYTSGNGVRDAEPAQCTGTPLRTLFPAMLQEPLWPTLTPLYRRSVLEAVGPWPAKRQLEDWEFDAQAGALGVKLHYCDEFLAEVRDHGEGRICQLWMTDVGAMRDRVDAYAQVLRHAQSAGVPRESAEMQKFARSLFWMARNAGSYGLPDEARRLFELARGVALRPGWDYTVFRAATRVLGWQRSSRLAEVLVRP